MFTSGTARVPRIVLTAFLALFGCVTKSIPPTTNVDLESDSNSRAQVTPVDSKFFELWQNSAKNLKQLRHALTQNALDGHRQKFSSNLMKLKRESNIFEAALEELGRKLRNNQLPPIVLSRHMNTQQDIV